MLIIALGGQRDGPPYEPHEALTTFELADGFQIEVFAAEPVIADPVDMEVDEYGRVYVVEMPGYPLDTGGTGRIRLLKDADGDGHPDESVIFADSLILPTGIIRWKEGLLVTDAPDVVYLEDVDGDGRADRREVVLTGFARSNPQHNFNNPLYGLDNGIYLANNGTIHTETYAAQFGDQGREIHFPSRPEGPRLDRNANGRIVRFRPDTGLLEEMSGWSQFGHAFDTWGRHFLVGNSDHQFHEVIAARYLRRNPGLPVREAVAFTPDHGDAADVFPITIDPEHQLLTDRGVFTSAAGPTFYLGGIFPASYDRTTFVTESVHNLVHADLVEDDGASFTARRLLEGREFLASTDSWFRPVNTYVGPDGALYVIDYYRRVVEHPEWMDDAAIRSDRLYAGSDRGRIYRISPTGSPAADWLDDLRLGDRSGDELVARLGDPNGWWRYHAQRLLVDRRSGEVVRTLVREALEGESPVGRLHALWTLEGLDALENGVIRAALSDVEPGVRENAVRLVERHGASSFEDALLAMAEDPDPKVRFQVLLTLGEVDTKQAAAVRDGLLQRGLGDRWVQLAALTAGARPDTEALKSAVAAFGHRPAGRTYLNQMAALVAASGSRDDVQAAVDHVLDGEGGWRGTVLEGLASGMRRREGAALRLDAGRLTRTVYEADDPALRRGALSVLGHAEPDVDAGRAMDIAADPAQPAQRRADLLALVELADPREAAGRLREIISTTSDPAVQAAAVRVIGGRSDGDVGRFLLAEFGRLSTAARDEALDALLHSEARAMMLLDAVERGDISRSALGWRRRVALMRDWEGEVKTKARRLLRASDASRAEVVRSYEEALDVVGDADRGEAVFYAACARCHGVGGPGAAFAPDLGTVKHWSSRALLDAILIPNKAVADGYALWQVRRRGGETITGVLRSETSSAATLILEAGREVVVPRAEIMSMRQLDGSAMPAGLEEEITVREMADLLAFIRGK